MFPNSFFCFVISFLNQWDFSRDLGLFLPSLYVQPRVTVLIACTDCPAGKWLSSTIHLRKDKTARQELNLRSCFLILTDRNYFFSYLVVFIKTIISLCSVKWWIFTSLLCSFSKFPARSTFASLNNCWLYSYGLTSKSSASETHWRGRL